MVVALGSFDGGSLNQLSGNSFLPQSGTTSLYQGSFGAYSSMTLFTSPATPPRSRSCASAYTSNVGWML